MDSVVPWMLSDREIRERLGPLPGTSAQSAGKESAPPINRAWWLLGVSAAAVVGLWCAGAALVFRLGRTAPHRPDPRSGEIYRFSDLRNVLYLTAHQHTLVVAAVIGLSLLTLFTVLAAAIVASSGPSALSVGDS